MHWQPFWQTIIFGLSQAAALSSGVHLGGPGRGCAFATSFFKYHRSSAVFRSNEPQFVYSRQDDADVRVHDQPSVTGSSGRPAPDRTSAINAHHAASSTTYRSAPSVDVSVPLTGGNRRKVSLYALCISDQLNNERCGIAFVKVSILSCTKFLSHSHALEAAAQLRLLRRSKRRCLWPDNNPGWCPNNRRIKMPTFAL